jgi:TonB family protein
MSFQALLFCPDEKTARAVTQVLSELDFAVAACTEPFAAVKKLMGERFDAVVVDCENEQNATLLFKSARSAANNQGALAVAVVEGQAGVAKAFRIGANLVLTRPINIEQAKGTLRVARGLLRKNEAAKPANTGAPAPAVSKPSPMPAKPAAQAATPIAVKTVKETAPTVPLNLPQPTAIAADMPAAAEHSIAAPSTIASASSGFAASAPAPARSKPNTSREEKSPDTDSGRYEEPNASDEAGVKAEPLPAPSFTFGGTIDNGAEATSGGKKKLVAGIAAAVVIAAAAYGAWMKYGSARDAASAPANVETQPTPSQAYPAPVAQTPAAATKPSAIQPQTTPGQITGGQTSAKTSKPELSTKSKATAETSGAGSAETADNDVTVTDLAHQPIMIKNGHSKAASKSKETAAPDVDISEIAASSGEALPNLMGATSAPTPVLQKLTVSQGVSRGLLIKEVQPVYPRTAIEMKIEGAVQLMAVVTKNGGISETKVLSGDKTLAQAAVDAVKKWKYKPYLLNGEPVDIQTQITVNFKLPR